MKTKIGQLRPEAFDVPVAGEPLEGSRDRLSSPWCGHLNAGSLVIFGALRSSSDRSYSSP